MEFLKTSFQKQFRFFIFVSLTLHIFVFAVLLFFPDSLFTSKPAYIKEAIRVDVRRSS